MSEINILGDLSELRASKVQFNIALSVEGTHGHQRVELSTIRGISQYLPARAYAKIIGSTLLVKVTGSVTQTRSIDAHLCVIPNNTATYPNTAVGVASVPGSCFVQHSVTSAGTSEPLRFPDGVAEQLKPRPVWGEVPSLVVVYEILGGTAQSTATIKISGTLEVGGIGFVQTW